MVIASELGLASQGEGGVWVIQKVKFLEYLTP